MAEKKVTPSQKPLKVRARAKNKKPKFERAENWKYDRFSLSWRRPRGLDNKIRRKIKGWPPGPSSGYKGPKIARGLHPSGFREVMVFNVADLSGIDPATQAARIAHTVGKRKRAEIIAKAKELNLKILNIKVSAQEAAEEETEEEGAEGEEVTEEETAKEAEEKPKVVEEKTAKQKEKEREKKKKELAKKKKAAAKKKEQEKKAKKEKKK
jgi:large subunit ribosomal protein L32e